MLYGLCVVFVCGSVHCVFSCGCVSLAMWYVMLDVVFVVVCICGCLMCALNVGVRCL